MSENKVQFGIKNVHYAPMLTESTWGTPKPIHGSVALNLNPIGESGVFYADNIAYFRSDSNEGYEGDIEVATLPVDFYKDIYGYEEGSTSKVLVENSNKISKAFALLFEEEGDTSGTKYVGYKCTASRPKKTFKTKGKGFEPQTLSISLKFDPMENGNVIAFTQSTTPSETVQNWYTKVFEEV